MSPVRWFSGWFPSLEESSSTGTTRFTISSVVRVWWGLRMRSSLDPISTSGARASSYWPSGLTRGAAGDDDRGSGFSCSRWSDRRYPGWPLPVRPREPGSRVDQGSRDRNSGDDLDPTGDSLTSWRLGGDERWFGHRHRFLPAGIAASRCTVRPVSEQYSDVSDRVDGSRSADPVRRHNELARVPRDCALSTDPTWPSSIVIADGP